MTMREDPDKTYDAFPLLNGHPLLDDQPSLVDSLDFTSYVQALKDLIAHEQTRTPLTLGIFGRWGMGKTTLMQMLEKDLANEGITTIWFNAWQYNNEDELWAAFLQSMLNKIHTNLGSFQLPIFKIKLLLRRVEWNKFPRLVIEFLFRIVLVILPILFIDPVSQQLNSEAKPIISAGGNISAMVLAIWIVIKPIVDSIQKNININVSDFQQTSNYQEHIAFLDKFREHFSDIVQSLPQKADKRLAVFIDDLDRCSSERTIQVLDAIKLFVDVKGCVFVLGLDVEVAQKAVALKYKDDLVAQREYMGKIIQLPFQLPPLTRVEMQKFLTQLTLNLPDTNCQNVFVTGLVVNPREIKRTINIFSLLWNLSSRRSELIGKIHPVRLAKVVVIQQGFPELHKILQQRPYLLVEIERFYRKQIESAGDNQPVLGDIEKTDRGASSLPSEVLEYVNNDSLRSMLLLHSSKIIADNDNDEYNFENLSPEDVAIYFTLTNRAESPNLEVDDMPQYFTSYSKIQPDNIVEGRYKVNFELGRGGTSVVYLVRDLRLERDVALKVLSEATQNMARRFKREMQVLAKLRHPSLVPVYDFSESEEGLYYTMQYLPGGTLKEMLQKKGKLSNSEIANVILPILDAVDYIHQQGVIHRDIKPSQILFDDNQKPYLTDFSITKIIEAQDDVTELTGTGQFIGTPAYMSPEQIRGDGVDSRSDQYSIGIMLFEMLTGRKPYTASTPIEMSMKHINDPVPSPRTFAPDISSELEKIVVKLLSKEQKNRYQSVSVLRDTLKNAL